MTPEEELALLIEEQRQDDTHIVWPDRKQPDRSMKTISLDALAPGMHGATFGDLIGVDEDGEIISFLPRSRGFAMGRHIPHGTPGGYTNHGCKCPRCTAAQSARHREWYRKNRLRPFVTLSCSHCEESFETNQPHATYCSRSCRDKAYMERKGRQRRRELAAERSTEKSAA